MLTVHMIGNAHIDPVWLWRWHAGVGEVLSTCRTACDLLDEDPRLVFTRSDVWVYQRIEQLDPRLFDRIRAHVKAGRWAVVGGWYVQPDCNFPREESFRHHIESGRGYFMDRFGLKVTVGYNVDSFGHAASLPRILAEAGYDSYVMMRPMEHERSLPSNLFRWQSTEEAGGVREVLTWRIQRAYCTDAADLGEHVKAAIAAAVPGVDHVMCFYGVGDHGGGPTREQVAWINSHAEAMPGARLVYSHPRAFFDAVKPLADKVPVVSGELQMHAVGCYSAGRSIKKAARAAEHGLIMAERAEGVLGGGGGSRGGGGAGGSGAAGSGALGGAWEKLMFNQFHDTYGGTAIPAACEDAVNQLGWAREEAERALYAALYRHAAGFSPARAQRIVAFNASDRPFDGLIEWEPWLGGWKKFDGWLADAAGNPVPFQIVPSPSLANMPGIFLWRARMAPGEIVTWSLMTGSAPKAVGSTASSLVTGALGEAPLFNDRWKVSPEAPGSALLEMAGSDGGKKLFLGLDVVEDPSDTWSHGIDRYAGEVAGFFETESWKIEESGPVRASLRIDARYRENRATIWARLLEGDPRVTLDIHVDWREKLRVLKLVLEISGMARERRDGIPGGGVIRAQDGKERPVVDWTLVSRGRGQPLGIAIPDCSALDGTPEELRFTLLRSPVYSWHDPAVLPTDRFLRYMDRGEHDFRFAIVSGATPAGINDLALGMHRPPAVIDWTLGMR